MSRHSPEVSVLMAVHNAVRYVAEAVDGVRAQTFRNWELIALDDGSTDGSLDALGRYAALDPRVTVISRPRKGVVVTRNELLAAASAPLVAVHDADDISMPSRLELQVRHLNLHPECVAVGSRVTLFGPRDLVVGEDFVLEAHAEIDRANMKAQGSAIAHSASMYRTSAARQVGGYRQEFPPSEDLDLWLRLGEVGQLANLPDVLLRYRLSEGSLSHSQRLATRVGAWRAAREAHARRGIRFSLAEPQAVAEEPLLRVWARHALASGRFAAARRLSFEAACRHPLAWASWRLFLGSLAGRRADRVIRARDAVVRALRPRGGDRAS